MCSIRIVVGRIGIHTTENGTFYGFVERGRQLALEAQVPPYVIFHDATLREMARARPTSLDELGEIGGVGARKLDAYGEYFLDVILRH